MKNDTHLNHNVFYNKKKDQYKGFCKTLSSIAHENLRGVQKCQLKINWILTFFFSHLTMWSPNFHYSLRLWEQLISDDSGVFNVFSIK